MTDADDRVVERIVELAATQTDRPLLVAIDGVDGAGKTEYSARLCARLLAAGTDGHVIHIDDFHKLREDRYRRGRDSPEGFWLDSYDYDAFAARVVTPVRSGLGRFRAASSDLDADAVVTPAEQAAAPGSVVIVEGIFLHRDELVDAWDFSIFLEVPIDESLARMAVRDGSPDDREDPRVRLDSRPRSPGSSRP